MPEYSALGKRIPRVDAVDKVTGRAVFSADVILPGMLHGKVLRSRQAHARIVRLDTSKARALQGVLAVITAEDVPAWKGREKVYDPMVCLLAHEKVIFSGQPLAAVAAINPHIAEAALKLIQVEFEGMDAVIDIQDAMRPDAPLVHADTYTENLPRTKPSNIFWHARTSIGDVKAGFKEADIVLENTFCTRRVHQGYLEPRAAIASVDPGGKVTVWTDNQHTFGAREMVAHFMDLPLNYVKVIPTEVGGAFGGKEPQPLAPLCALLSQKTGRPVRMVMTRAEVFEATRPAPDTVITVKTGVKKDGRLTAVSATMIYDYGALHGVHGMAEVPFASFTGLSPYNVPNMNIECFSVYTNKAPSGPYRAPTAPQGAFAVESQMDLTARALGMDPIDFRLINAVDEGDTALMTRQPYEKIGLKEGLGRMKQHLAQKGIPRGENAGRGVACGFWSPGAGGAAANVNLNADGSVMVNIGAIDISGSRTGLVQVAAEELGIPVDHVSIATGDTDTAPYCTPSVGSMISRSAGFAVRLACQNLKEQVCISAAAQLETQRANVVYDKGRVSLRDNPEKSITLSDLAWRSINMMDNSPITGNSVVQTQPPSPVFVVQAADVEVDRETGKIKVLSFTTAQDAGVAINPILVEGQIQGAAAQGIGWAFFENYLYKDG
ncbi:MAG TPA: xanthine dehydrogenase family protein molybdopterin-binding subunit, partial [Dehalococcoidia bacterium]|nr:xanthine dehydrogenase family protein molybdopterin-binding subunit [Dehalococcoidia bacterium]